jgi:hypothetical protein
MARSPHTVLVGWEAVVPELLTNVEHSPERRGLKLVVICAVATGCGGVAGRTTATDASTGPDASTPDVAAGCLIETASFDHSCNLDSDCVATTVENFAITSGDYCAPICLCPTDAINQAGAAAYFSAVSRTPIGTGAIPAIGCNCGVSPNGPCCVAGQCKLSCPATTTCDRPPCSTSEQDSGLSDASAGFMPDGSVLCSSQVGPLDASAEFGDAAVYSCGPPEVCTPYNAGWACCMKAGPEQTFCRQVPINR